MAKKKESKMRSVQCSKCRGAGKYVSMTGVGWNSDFWSTCGSCGGSGRITYDANAKRCFIATAAYGNYNAPEVVYLSNFRDESLSRSPFGRNFIRAYYAISPPFAAIIAKSDFLRSAVRKTFLQPMIFLLKQFRR